jgi:very-short-patch-repair endonuclease
MTSSSIVSLAKWETEFKFHPTRKWRFDFANPTLKIAIEQEGGIWTGGRHTRGIGFLKDIEKYNTATSMGWRILRFSTQQIAKMEYVPFLEALISQDSRNASEDS